MEITNEKVEITASCGHARKMYAAFLGTEKARSHFESAPCPGCQRMQAAGESLERSDDRVAEIARANHCVGIDGGINWMWYYFGTMADCEAFVATAKQAGEQVDDAMEPWSASAREQGWKFATRVHK